MRTAPIRHRAESSLGKMRMTRSQRQISRFTRWTPLVVRSPFRYLGGQRHHCHGILETLLRPRHSFGGPAGPLLH